MAVKKIYAVDSATVMKGTEAGVAVLQAYKTVRGNTETIDTVTPNGTVGTYKKRPFYVFENAPPPSGTFVQARVIIPKATSQNLNASAYWAIMSQRPTSASAAAQIWNNMMSNMGWYPAPTNFSIFPGGAFHLGCGKEDVGNVIAYGVILHDADGQSIQNLYTARSDLSVRPYIEYTYNSVTDPPTVTITSPMDIVVDSDASNVFTWTYSQVLDSPQSHVDIQYLYEGTWYPIASKTALAAQTYTVPAGTLKPGATAWRVRAYGNSGNSVSEWAQANITVISMLNEPPAISILSPKDIIVDGDISNIFAWSYSQAVGSPQSHVDIQYLYGDNWQWLANKTPLSEQQYTIPAGTLQSGQTQWRMRAYCNGGNAVSEWESAEITVKARPGDPVISGAIGLPRPTISWTHDGQQSGYQVRVMPVGMGSYIIDTGTVYTTSTFWQSQEFLPNGDYAISLRIVNADQVWSNWVNIDVTVQNQPGDPITLRSEATRDYGVRLTWETEGRYTQYIILRNGKPVAVTQGTNYTDYLSIGAVSYIVRGITGNYYTDSNERGDRVKVHNAAVSSVDEISWLKLEVRRGSRPVHEVSMVPNAAYLRFEGRSRPHRQTDDSNYADVSHRLMFTFRDRESYLKLKELVNKTVIYKDCMGELVVGNLDSVESTLDRVYDFELVITETDFNEAVYV